MESEGWLRTEPELGQVATVLTQDDETDDKEVICECVLRKNYHSGQMEKYWSNRFDFCELASESYWQPITTPEERRLKAEVERLREFRDKVFDYFDGENELPILVSLVAKAVRELRETEAGGAGK